MSTLKPTTDVRQIAKNEVYNIPFSIKWVEGRGTAPLKFNKPWNAFVLGKRGSGKSSLLETLGVDFLNSGACVIDLYGSNDGENLAWLRSSFARYIKVLLLTGKDVEVKTELADCKSFEEFSLKDILSYNLIINSSLLYRKQEETLDALNLILDECYQRRGWARMIAIISREAANIFYARIKIAQGNVEKAKHEATRLIRESRHHGIAMLMDSLRWKSVDIDIRVLSDNVFIKRIGVYPMPDDLHWLFKYIDAEAFRNLKPANFVMINSDGPVGYGSFPYHSWHKEPQEDILKTLGLDILDSTSEARNEKEMKFHKRVLELGEKKIKAGDIGILVGRETKEVRKEILLHENKMCDCFVNI